MIKTTKISLIIVFAVILNSIILFAQEQRKPDIEKKNNTTVSFFEEQNNGKLRPIGGENGNIINLRGQIEIIVDKGILRERLISRYPVSGELIEAIKGLNNLVQARQKSIIEISTILQEFDSPLKIQNKVNHDEFITKINSVANPIASMLKNKYFGKGISDRFDLRVESIPDDLVLDIKFQYELFFEAAAEELKFQQSLLVESVRNQGVFIQLGAWLNREQENRPLHLAGFDNNATPAPYDPNPWKLVFTQEQIKELKNANDLAKEINDGNSTIWQELFTNISNSFKTALANTPTIKSIQAFEDKLEKALEKLKKEKTGLIDEINKAKSYVKDYESYIKNLKDKYTKNGTTEKLTPELFLSGTLIDINDIIDKTNKLFDSLKDSIKNIENQIKSASTETKNLLNSFPSELHNILKNAENDATSLFNSIKQSVNILLNGRNFDMNVYKFGENILEHDLATLPDRTTLSMRDIGYREPGDELVFILGIGSSGKSATPEQTARFFIYYTEIHPEIKVGLIFAHPHKSLALQKYFQAAPAYSILLKFPSKKSLFYNRVFDPGLGINVAALDFNNDQSLELGLGLVLSVFKDYLQIGYGHNITENEGYFFLGVRLPFPNLVSTSNEK